MIYINLEGRIGNNLWQIGAAATLAERLGEEFVAVPNRYYHCPEPDDCLFTEYIKPYKQTIFRNVRFADECPADCYCYEYETDLTDIHLLPAANVRLEGYFQDIRYVSEEVVKRLFLPTAQQVEEIEHAFAIHRDMQTCAVVVRRGDYTRLPMQFPTEDMCFYRKCMRLLEHRLHTHKVHYFIISDDTDWCARHFSRERFTIVPHIDPLTDLYVASLCRHNIISNSSFAQWGALLNRNTDKTVLYPSPWFGISNRRLDNHGANMPTGWTKVHHISGAYLKGVCLYLYYGTMKHVVKLKKILFPK